MLTITLMILSLGGIQSNGPAVGPDVDTTTRYRNEGSVKASNKWNRLNLSPKGVEIEPIRKSFGVIVKKGEFRRL